jgi:galactonate dehydratase
MKITNIEALVCHARMRNWVFVKVLTDQPGLYGWGEATLEWHTRAVVGAVQDLAELVVGEDPRRIEHLWQMMYRQHFWHGHGIVRATAIAGIDLALWDIAGKIAGMPCCQLWGGPVRDYVRTYCHLGGGRMEDFYETSVEDVRKFGDLARQAVADGFTAFKAMAVPPTMPIEGLRPIRLAEAAVQAMREAAGDGIDIMVDCHARPSPAMGLKFGQALEPYGLYFFEEPCWPESIEGLAMINQAITTPVATGERITELSYFRQLFAQRGCEICQLDITHCGGLTAARRIAALADAHRAGASQPPRPRQHGGIAGIRLLATQLHHLRNRARRRALAGRCRGRRLCRRAGGTPGAAQHASRPGHLDQRRRNPQAPVPAGVAATGVLSGRERGGLVRSKRQRVKESKSRKV